MDPREMNRLAKAALTEKDANEKRAAKLKAEEEAENRRKLTERQMREWPTYIRDKIEKAARRGEFTYEFECGECEQVVIDLLFKEFAAFKPCKGWAQKKEVVNYDMGTYRDYSVGTIKFFW